MQARPDLAGYLGKKVTITVDRPLGSRHPKWGFLYPVNYGYIEGTEGGDGEPQDAYILGVTEPVERFEGVCIAIMAREDDDEDKLVVAKEDAFSDQEIMDAVDFQERWFRTRLIRRSLP